jgi:hypothetical protein
MRGGLHHHSPDIIGCIGFSESAAKVRKKSEVGSAKSEEFAADILFLTIFVPITTYMSLHVFFSRPFFEDRWEMASWLNWQYPTPDE